MIMNSITTNILLIKTKIKPKGMAILNNILGYAVPDTIPPKIISNPIVAVIIVLLNRILLFIEYLPNIFGIRR